MVKNIKLKWLYILILFFTISNCSKNNDGAEALFDETTDERIENQKREFRDLLLSSSEGWKMLYFTKDDEFGGFTFLMKFEEDGTVTMTSDVNDDTDVIESKYNIELGSTVKLNFTTFNHIHKLTDSFEPSELRGEGYKGSGEFLFYGGDSDTIILRSVKDVENEYIVFVKATTSDWDSLIDENLANHNRLVGFPTDPVYRGIKVTVNGEEIIYPYTYDYIRRYISVTGLTSEGLNIDRSFGVGFAEGGFIASPAVNLSDQIFTEFIYDEDTNRFISTNENGAIAEFLFLDAPIVISDDYLDVNNLPGGGFYQFSYSEASNYASQYLREAIETSPKYLEIFDATRQTFADEQGGREFYRFYVTFFEDTNEGYVRYLYYSGSSTYTLYHYFTYEFVDKKLVLNDNYWSTTNGTRKGSLTQIDELLFSSDGFYVERLSKKYYYSNVVYTFTSAADTSIRFAAYSY